jgi:predicted transcriptional regulator
MKMNFSQKQELIAEIRNKMQPCCAVLDLIADKKTPSENLVKAAKINLSNAIKLLRALNKE